MADDSLTCKHCGRDDFGNAGARANHESSCEKNPNVGAQDRQSDRRGRGRRREGRRDGGGELARQDQPTSAGGAVADMVVQATDDTAAPKERAGAVQGLLSVVTNGLARYQQLRDERMAEREERARNVELEPAVEYPVCDGCGYQFDEEGIPPNDEKVRCPECQSLWRIQAVEDPDVIDAN